jgi:hypothetical protein
VSGAGAQAELERLQEIAALGEKVRQKQFDLAISLLDPEDQLNNLYRERSRLLRSMAASTDELAKLHLQDQLLDVEARISKFQSPRGRPATGGGLSFSTDQLSRLGIYTSGGAAGFASLQANLQRRTLNEIQALRRDVQSQTRTIDDKL